MPESELSRPARSSRRVIDLQALEVFVRVCETGNMTAAGKTMGMTQSAVSHVIKQIEEETGVVLVDRTVRPVTLTAAGNLLRRNAERLIQEADQMMGLVRSTGTATVPFIGLGIVNSFAVSIGPKLVPQIHGRAAEISIRSGTSPILRKALLRREVDMIITSESLDDLDHVDTQRLLQEPFMLVLSKASAERFKELDLVHLARAFPLIRYSSGSTTAGQIDRHLRRIRLETTSNLELDTSETILAMVLNDLGWTIATPLALMQSSIRAAELHVAPFPDPGFSRSLSLAWRRSELLALPREIAALCHDLLSRDAIPALQERFPSVADRMLVG